MDTPFAFIRSAAIAAHSGFDWKKRAREIAKLTALDVEFPVLGADLRSEPRLPELLLDRPSKPSERIERLLAKHGGIQISRGPGGASKPDLDDEANAPEDPILASVSEEEKGALAWAEHENLRRYLARTRGVTIGRDLLFLDRAGAAVGLEDVELAELLDEAVDVPSNVAEALEGRDAQTRRLAAKVLADMVDREFGEERVNVMTALMGTIAVLDDVSDVADAAAGSIASYARDERLDKAHLAAALSVAIAATGFGELESSILEDERLLSDPDALIEAGALLPRVSTRGARKIREAIAASVPEGGEVLLGVLRRLPDTDAAKLLTMEPAYAAVSRFLGPDTEEPREHDQLIEDVYEIAEERGAAGAALRGAVHHLLLKEEVGYEPFQRHAERVLGEMRQEERDLDVLLALLRFGYRDPDFWLSQLSDGKSASAGHGLHAARISVARLRDADFASEDEPGQFLATVERLAPFLRMSGEEQRSELREGLETRLEQAAWWGDETACDTQAAIHRVGHALAAAEVLGDLDDLLADDLRRAPLDAQALSELTARGLTTMGNELGRAAEAVLGALPQAEDEGNSAPVWTTRARVALALAARRVGAQQDSSVVSNVAIDQAAAAESQHGTAAVVDWLQLGPGADAVGEVLRKLEGRSRPAVEKAAEAWCAEAPTADRSRLAEQLLGNRPWEGRWLELLVAAGVDELSLVEQIADQVRGAAQGSRRQELADSLTRVNPVDPKARKAVADLMVALVESGKQVDFKAAVKMIPALGTEHRSARRLREAFQTTADTHGFQLSERAAVQLAEAKVKVSKKSVKKGVWGQVRDLFR